MRAQHAFAAGSGPFAAAACVASRHRARSSPPPPLQDVSRPPPPQPPPGVSPGTASPERDDEIATSLHGAEHQSGGAGADGSAALSLTAAQLAESSLRAAAAAHVGGEALLPQLTSLSLASSRLRALPDGLEALVGLRSLSLDHNELSALPAAVCQLPRLAHLSLFHNKLKAIDPILNILA